MTCFDKFEMFSISSGTRLQKSQTCLKCDFCLKAIWQISCMQFICYITQCVTFVLSRFYKDFIIIIIVVIPSEIVNAWVRPSLNLEFHLYMLNPKALQLPTSHCICFITVTRGWGESMLESSDGRVVCWWNVVSQTPPTNFKYSKWNLLHMIPMLCRCAWHNWLRPGQRVPQLCPFFQNSYISLFHVAKMGIGFILITFSG